MIPKNFVLGFCACGCGIEIPIRNKKKLLSRFVKNHHTKIVKHNWMPKGKDHYKYKNGITKSRGYNILVAKEHPKAIQSNSYRIPESHLIFEHYLKILFDEDVYIPKGIDIHHIDRNKQNNSLINLQPMSKKEHSKLHHPKGIKFGM
jgi:glycosyltransferase involved in cell wall biosynthesis